MPATTHLIGAYGLHWARGEIDWHPGQGRGWQLLGRRGHIKPGLRICDFRFAAGVYVLEKHSRPVYAGLARSGHGLGARLLAHTDDGTKNWTRFSWFSFDAVWLDERRKTYPAERCNNAVMLVLTALLSSRYTNVELHSADYLKGGLPRESG